MLASRLLPLSVLLVAFARPALAGDFGPHNFSGSVAYPHLAARAATNFCLGCHSRKAQDPLADSGNDFISGIAVVTDPSYRVQRTDGTTVGPRRHPSLPSSMRCLGCHDGIIRTATGVDRMPVPYPSSGGLNLDWAAGGAHNIWMMGQDSAYHPVEIHYPPDRAEEMWPGFRTLYINGDNNRVMVNGTWTIVDPTLSPSGLPLVTDPNDPTKGYITCETCHATHGPNPYGDFLRVDWPNLCFMCHRQTKTPSATSSPDPAATATTARGLQVEQPPAGIARKGIAAGDRAAWKQYFWDLSREPARK